MGREGDGKGGRKKGGEGRKVRTPPLSIPAYAPGVRVSERTSSSKNTAAGTSAGFLDSLLA